MNIETIKAYIEAMEVNIEAMVKQRNSRKEDLDKLLSGLALTKNSPSTRMMREIIDVLVSENILKDKVIAKLKEYAKIANPSEPTDEPEDGYDGMMDGGAEEIKERFTPVKELPKETKKKEYTGNGATKCSDCMELVMLKEPHIKEGFNPKSARKMYMLQGNCEKCNKSISKIISDDAMKEYRKNGEAFLNKFRSVAAKE